MTKKKKIIVMTTLVLLLVVTAVLNVILAKAKTKTQDASVTTTNYFTTYRTERTNSRNEEILQLDNILATFATDSEKYNDAAELKIKLVNNMENELVIETMIKSLGFQDAVVSIGVDSSNVNVFINSNELDYDSALSIYQLLKNEMGVPASNIIIMPVYSQI